VPTKEVKFQVASVAVTRLQSTRPAPPNGV